MTGRALAAPALCAAANPAPCAAAGVPLQLAVIRNGEPTQLIAAFIQWPDGRFTATAEELRAVGVLVPSTDDLVDLGQVDGLTFVYDEIRQEIRLKVAPRLLEPINISLKGARGDSAPPSRDLGAVLNYSLAVQGGDNPERKRFGVDGASGVFDARIFGPFGRATSGMAMEATSGRTRAVRLDSTWTWSNPKGLSTWAAGDVITSGFSWTRPLRLGGVQWRRDFGLRPDMVTMPIPTLSGSAATPSTLEVLLGKSVIYSSRVSPGDIRISDLPISQGQGQAELRLRDAFGVEQRITAAYFATPDLLRPGMLDFSVQAGFARRGFGVKSNDYDSNPVAVASARYGVNPALTIQGHAEAGKGVALAGAGVVGVVGKLGVASASVAGSRYDDKAGALMSAAFESRAGVVVLSAQAQKTIGEYSDLAMVTAHERWTSDGFRIGRPTRSIVQGAVSAPIRLAILERYGDAPLAALSFARVEEADGSKRSLVTASVRYRLAGRVSLQAAAYATGSERSAFFGVSVPLGDDHTATAGMDQGQKSRAYAEIRRQERLEPGATAWRVRADQGETTTVEADLVHRSRVGRLEGRAFYQGGDVRLDARIDGAVVWMGGAALAPDRVDGAFAMVDVGAPHVEVRNQNRLIGTSNARGRLLALNLNAYDDNALDIRIDKIPISLITPVTRQVVRPPYGAGAMVRFGVAPAPTQVTVSLRMADGQPAPPGAKASLNGGPADIIIGYDGLIFLATPKADNRLRVDLGGKRACVADLSIASATKGLVHAPDIICR